MPRLSLWNSGIKGSDYKFIDRTISEYFGVSGTAVYVHLYLGVHDQSEGGQAPSPTPEDIMGIQDVLLLENRDRRYSPDVIELRGIYNVQDNDFDLRQFGLFLTGDTLFIEVHLNDMLAMCGRKLMAGDVIELPHQRDEDLLDPNSKAINKFYVVEDASRATSGYSATWYPHIWRIKVSPMHNAQEYQDILDRQAKNPLGVEQGRLGDLMAQIGRDMAINEAVVEQATISVPRRYFETRQFWVIPGEENGGQYPWIFAGDGDPPNGAVLTGSGNQFPSAPEIGDYFLRTDYEPRVLFRFESGRWRRQELDYRTSDWSAANSLLMSFLENTKQTTLTDGTVFDEKQALSKAVKPRADF